MEKKSKENIENKYTEDFNGSLNSYQNSLRRILKILLTEMFESFIGERILLEKLRLGILIL